MGSKATTAADSLEFSTAQLLRHHAQELADFFNKLRVRYSKSPPQLLESIEYSLLAGGKRLRPTLVIECWRACGGDDKSYKSALAAAAAIELIHTFSLVHDDLPAMDDDDLRRGRPTNHKVYGEAMAILAGDAMVTMAFQLLATDTDPAVAPSLISELAAASGPDGMIGGQVLDMNGENTSLALPQLRHLHAMKTGALLTAACRLGALAAKADGAALAAVTDFGIHLGLAFQIVDDVLDCTSTPQQLGKATGKDAGRGKNTYPSLLGLEASRQEATRQLALAWGAIDRLGGQAATLRELAQFVVQRDH